MLHLSQRYKEIQDQQGLRRKCDGESVIKQAGANNE